MREIKFRAWDKKAKYMFLLDDPNYFLNNNGLYERKTVDFMGDEYNNVSELFELMQFTGLLDKNGKEIWEGDIVEYIDGYGYSIRSAVEYGDGYFSPLVVVKEGRNCLDQYCADCFEVIGNIWENGDLLK